MDAELHRRVRALADELPGGNMSSVVEMALEMNLPHLEKMAAVAKGKSPEEAAEAAVLSLFRSLVLHTENDEEKLAE